MMFVGRPILADMRRHACASQRMGNHRCNASPVSQYSNTSEDAGKAAADCDAQKIWSLVHIWLTDLPDKPNKTDPSE